MPANGTPNQQPPTPQGPDRSRLTKSVLEFFTGMTRLATAALGVGAVAAVTVTITIALGNPSSARPQPPALDSSPPAGEQSGADRDSDTVLDADDNCPLVANRDQENTNNAGRGDACDEDDDNDTVLDESDNCRTVENRDQENADGDEHGDACDADDGANGGAVSGAGVRAAEPGRRAAS